MMIDRAPLDAEVVEDMDVNEAAALTGRIRAWVNAFPAEDVKRAYEGRIWVALGYDSWSKWCDCELDGFQLPVVERREIVAELTESGMSGEAIADVLGVGTATVSRDRATLPNERVNKSVGKDGREINTENIGKSPAKREPNPSPEPRSESPPPASASNPKQRDPLDQAHSDASVINAFADLIQSTFTEVNMRDVTLAAKQHLIRLLEAAIETLKKEDYA